MTKTSILLIGSLSGAALFALMTYAIYPRIERSKQPDITDPLDWITFILPYRAPTHFDGDLDNVQRWFPPQLVQIAEDLIGRTSKYAQEAIEPQEPVIGGSCSDMQNYFNKNFGRSDTKFSNYEGQIGENFIIFSDYKEASCQGGVVIQSLPTGKKTCSASILYDSRTKKMRWEVNDTSTDCFVSQ